MKTKLLLFLLLLPLCAAAQTYTFSTLTKFPAASKGSAVNPFAPIVDSSGNVYGISFYGGKHNQGTVWKTTPKGVLSVVYSFGATPTDGALPEGMLIRDSAGNLYGETYLGGSSNNGTVFKVTPIGTETILYSFSEAGAGSGMPLLARDSAGNLYGYNVSGSGSVFKLTPTGKYSTIYTFCSQSNCADGMSPSGGPILKNGVLYGVTGGGGGSTACSPANGCGTIFKVTTGGVETVLYAFAGNSDASTPIGPLVEDSAGNWYGSSYYGGTGGYGTVFKLSSSNVESLLHDFSFCTSCTDGFYPNTALIIDSEGNLFGIASEGGTDGLGTIYKVTVGGAETTVYESSIRAGLGSGLAMDKSGNLYGTSFEGGPNHTGTVYKLTKN